MMYCKHCGGSLESSTKFCPHCGKSTQEAPIASTGSHTETKKTAPIWFKTLIGLIILIISAILLNAFFAEDLTDTVENQLKAVRKGQLTEAYYAFSSKKFQEATSLEAFNEFIKNHPAFSQNKSILFKERNVNNDVGTLDAVLTTNDDKKILVEYKLVEEDDTWKILSIRLEEIINAPIIQANDTQKQVVEPIQPNSIDTLKFSQFVLGNTLSPLGIVKNPSSAFKTDSGDLYLNLYITDANAGTQIKVIFEHLDSRSNLNPVTTRTTDNGESILSFVFSPPQSGWPKGNYRIVASSANGIKESFDFIIE